MKEETFSDWFKKLGEAWCALDSEAAANLFSKDVKYYESVFENQCENWDAVLNLWKVIPDNQKDVSYEFKILSISENLAVANWKVTRTLMPGNKFQEIDGIFVIKLNEEGLCSYFKQWRTVNK